MTESSPVIYSHKVLASLVKKGGYSSVYILTDDNTFTHCYPRIQPLFPDAGVLKMKAGEKNKNLKTCEEIWKLLLETGADRNSLLINLGGGVVCDTGGFCASVYMRGIDFLHIPTTLMAMADASVGGKTGVDLNAFKNSIGTFSQPKAVCIDTAFLATLPERERVAASAELMKHALLQGGKEIAWFAGNRFSTVPLPRIAALVRRSVAFKTSIVKADEKENGLRKQLNLGHTFGHAIESWFLKKGRPLLHGEAVALGLVAECYLSHLYLGLELHTLKQILFWYDLNFTKPNLGTLTFDECLAWMRSDKKNRNSRIHFALLKAPAQPLPSVSFDDADLQSAFEFLQSF